MNKKLKEILYRSFDSPLDPVEARLLDDALRDSEELRREKEAIEEMRQALAAGKPEGFQPFFAEKVMNRIETMETESEPSVHFMESLMVYFRPMAIIATTAVLILLAINLKTGGNWSIQSALGLEENETEMLYEIPVVSYLRE
ncbi:MAG: hypothetical protein ACOYVF_02045 [Candidatus Zixiibacteriota bacterium]